MKRTLSLKTLKRKDIQYSDDKMDFETAFEKYLSDTMPEKQLCGNCGKEIEQILQKQFIGEPIKIWIHKKSQLCICQNKENTKAEPQILFKHCGKTKAIIIPCKHEAGPYQDNCSRCAPWWERLAICPQHKTKLNGSGYCKKCGKYYDTSEADL